ncbi:MAG: hypothetical protein HMLKMBBP_01111 [Planctomycetes bacterium]|nr:hypothetical protein [Planctomycetota bacterium]
MPTWAPLNDDPNTGDSIPVAFLELEGRTVELRKGFAGAAPPASPQEGQVWVDTAQTPYRVFRYLRIDAGNAGWQPVGPLSRLPAPINADPSIADDRMAPFEHRALRVENRNALPPATPLNAGLLVYRVGDGEVWLADLPVSGGWKGLLSVTPMGSFDTVELALEGDLGNDAVNPPTKARKGALEGWLFDDVAEKRTLAFIVPRNWQGASDLRLRLFQVLGQAQLAGDDIEWTGEVRTLIPGQDRVAKAATPLGDAVTDVGGDVEGIDDGGGPHLTELVIDHDDPANPVSAGCLVLATVRRKSVGGAGKAGGTVVFRADLAYAQRSRHERA